MPSFVIRYKNPERDKLLPADRDFPVPQALRGGENTHINFDRGGLYFWRQAQVGVSFTGVILMSKGAIYIRPLAATRPGNVPYTGGTISMGGGRETLRPIVHSATSTQMRNTFWEGLPSRSGHNQLGQSATWDQILLGMQGDGLKDRCKGFGSDDLFIYENKYVGFSITKQQGTSAFPHEVRMRSGTFNGKFTDKFNMSPRGTTVPTDWADVIMRALSKNLS